MKSRWFILILILLTTSLQGQVIRGLYVNRFDDILGNRSLEDDLCRYVEESRINHLLFYSLHRLDFSDPGQMNQLRSFISRLRTDYGVDYIGAVHESYEYFEYEIHPYNMDPATDVSARFNVLNLEFEYWSQSAIDNYYCERYLRPVGFPCTEDGAFMYVEKSLKAMQMFKKELPELSTEVYIGWIEPWHAVKLSGIVDRVLPAIYRSANQQGEINLYQYDQQRERLRNLALGGEVRIVPIFNGSLNDIGPNLYAWLQDGHTVCEPWDHYLTAFIAESDTLIRNRITPEGYVWFKYFSMPPVPYNLESPNPLTGPALAFTGDTVEYVATAVDGADRYRWYFQCHNQWFETGAGQTTIKIVLEKECYESVSVQAFACGEKSNASVIYTDIRRRISSDIGERVEAPRILISHDGYRLKLHTNLQPGTSSRLMILDLYGRLLLDQEVNSFGPGEHSVSLRLQTGVYLAICSGPGFNHSQKFVVGL